jgi:hypothetical protein
MAEKEKTKAASGQQEPVPSSSIAITNTYRNQPLLFHVIGGSVRLGPFETREISRDHLGSPELAHLVASGAVLVREIETADSPEDGDPAPRRNRQRNASPAEQNAEPGEANQQ